MPSNVLRGRGRSVVALVVAVLTACAPAADAQDYPGFPKALSAKLARAGFTFSPLHGGYFQVYVGATTRDFGGYAFRDRDENEIYLVVSGDQVAAAFVSRPTYEPGTLRCLTEDGYRRALSAIRAIRPFGSKWEHPGFPRYSSDIQKIDTYTLATVSRTVHPPRPAASGQESCTYRIEVRYWLPFMSKVTGKPDPVPLPPSPEDLGVFDSRYVRRPTYYLELDGSAKVVKKEDYGKARVGRTYRFVTTFDLGFTLLAPRGRG